MRRETSRVSVLLCPFCVRDLLSVLKTPNGGTWMRVISTLNLKPAPGSSSPTAAAHERYRVGLHAVADLARSSGRRAAVSSAARPSCRAPWSLQAWSCRQARRPTRLFTSASQRSGSSCLGGSGAGCDGGPCLVEVEELTIQAAALVQVAARNLDSSRVRHAAHLQRVEAGGADQPFDPRGRSVVIGGVEQHCATRLAVRGACERVGP